MTLTDLFFFVVLPYAAVAQILPAIVVLRRAEGPLAETASSPVLARERDGWASRAGWIGAVVLILLHVLPLLLGSLWSRLLGGKALYVVEFAGLIGGLLFLVGVAAFFLGRVRDAKLSPLRTALELSALAALVLSAVGGVATAVTVRWGAAWYAHVIGPYLWSLAKLSPEIDSLAVLGFWPRFHFAFAFLAMALVPFTTLPRQLRAPLLSLFGGSGPVAATGGSK
jgi:nitrate reductase gamma subunit